jgi:hypothetical protein
MALIPASENGGGGAVFDNDSHHSVQAWPDRKQSTSKDCVVAAANAPSTSVIALRHPENPRACNRRHQRKTKGAIIPQESQKTDSDQNAFVQDLTYPAQNNCDAKMRLNSSHAPA